MRLGKPALFYEDALLVTREAKLAPVRKQRSVGPKLGKLLDERADVRLKISLADEQRLNAKNLTLLRRQLVSLDFAILKRWEQPDA